MKRNHIVVFVNRKVEIEVRKHYILSILPLGKSRIRVTGHVRQVSITIKRQGGRRKHANNKAGNKITGILSIENVVYPALSVVKCSKVRFGRPLDIPMMSFGSDKKEDMSGYMTAKSKEGKKKQKSTAPKNVAASIFEKMEVRAWVKLANAIIDMMEGKPRTVKECIRTMREKAMIQLLYDLSCQLKTL